MFFCSLIFVMSVGAGMQILSFHVHSVAQKLNLTVQTICLQRTPNQEKAELEQLIFIYGLNDNKYNISKG